MIELMRASDSGIAVKIDGRPLELSWMWLRDHSRDEASYFASVEQRMVLPAVVRSVEPGTASTDGSELVVSWDGGPTSTYQSSFLASLGGAVAATHTGPEPKPWKPAELEPRLLRIDFNEIVLTDDGLRRALEHMWRDGLITVTDIDSDVAATRQVVERFGYIRSTIFGELWEFRSDGAYDDTASTPFEITPHTDGTYCHDAPGLLALHCHTYEATGGENVFVDGHQIARELSPTSLETLRTVEVPGQYIGNGSHLMSRRPPMRFDGDRLVQVSYNHHDRAPFVLPEPAMTELFDALQEFDAIANDPAMQFELSLRPGDMVIFDNWRLLHGRRAFEGERHIAGGYINREDVESTTRRLAG